MMRKLYLFMILISFGCSRPKESSIHITLVNNNSILKVNGIDSLILKDIASDTANSFTKLVPVYRMPADTDMKDYQPEQPGKYSIKNGELLFTPDTAFKNGQTYFMRYYRFSTQNSVWDFVTKRKSATAIKYNDLIFKP